MLRVVKKRSLIFSLKQSYFNQCQRKRYYAVSSSTPNLSSSIGVQTQLDLGRHFYLNKVLEQYAAKPATRMTLRQLAFFGKTLGRDRDKILKSANYVRQELAVRIAHRIRDLQALPFVVMTNKHLEEVYEKYWNAFETFRKIPLIKTMEDNEIFCTTLKRLLDDHLTIIPSLTIGIVESSHHLAPDQLDGFMERMLKSRISRRVLAEQHIALSEALDDPFHFFNDENNANQAKDEGDHIGIIYTQIKVSNIIEKVVNLLTNIFKEEVKTGLRRENSAIIPEIVIDGALETRFAYIPEHLEYIFFELLKNSMMAVMRQPISSRDPVSIRATIVEGPPDEDLIVRISDCGGGMSDVVAIARQNKREHKKRKIIKRKKEIENLDDETGKTSEVRSNEIQMDATLMDLPNPFEIPENDLALSKEKSVQPTTRVIKSTPSIETTKTDNTGSHESLLAIVTSFSNVQKRIELENHQEELNIRAESPGLEKQGIEEGLARLNLNNERATGIDSKERFEALKSVGRFKGTVAEQLANHTSISKQKNDKETKLLFDEATKNLSPPTASRSMTLTRRETGLGLPMTKIYTNFFGGSLSIRSLDGHGMDVYVRLPKLGTNKEAIEDIVL